MPVVIASWLGYGPPPRLMKAVGVVDALKESARAALAAVTDRTTPRTRILHAAIANLLFESNEIVVVTNPTANPDFRERGCRRSRGTACGMLRLLDEKCEDRGKAGAKEST